MTEPQHATLAAALAAFQAKLPSIAHTEKAKVKGESKDGRPVTFEYGYAGLETVSEAILPLAGTCGLAWHCATEIRDGKFMLVGTLMHASTDETRESVWPLAFGKPQDIGSAITYGRRYMMLAAFGVFPGGEDDDGARGGDVKESWDQATPARPPATRKAPPVTPARTTPDRGNPATRTITARNAPTLPAGPAPGAPKSEELKVPDQDTVDGWANEVWGEGVFAHVKAAAALYDRIQREYIPGTVDRGTRKFNFETGEVTSELDASRTIKTEWLDRLHLIATADGEARLTKAELTVLWDACKTSGVLDVMTESGFPFRDLIANAASWWDEAKEDR